MSGATGLQQGRLSPKIGPKSDTGSHWQKREKRSATVKGTSGKDPVKPQRAVRESNPVVSRRESNERQTKQDIINEICAACSSYSVEGDSAILLFLRNLESSRR